MTEENDWDHNMEGDVVDNLVVCVLRDNVLHMFNKMQRKSNWKFRCIIGVDCF